MGSNIISSSGPVMRDLAEAWRAFEEQNACRIVITLRGSLNNSKPDLWLDGKLLSDRDVNGVRSLLASSQITGRAANTQNLEAAIFQLLYALDFQLAENEWHKKENGGSRPPDK